MRSLLHQKVSRQNDKMKLIALKAMLLLFLWVVFFYLRGGYLEETPPLPNCDSDCMICKPLYLWLWERVCIPFSFPCKRLPETALKHGCVVLKFWKSQVWNDLTELTSSYQQDDGAPETIVENSRLFSSFLTLSRCLPVSCLPSSSKLMASQVFFMSPFSDKSLWLQYALWCLRFSPISSSWFNCLKSTCRHNNSLALSAS